MIQTARDRVDDADGLVIHSDDQDEMGSFLMALHWDRLTWTNRHGDFRLIAPDGAELKYITQQQAFTASPEELAKQMYLQSFAGLGGCKWKCSGYQGIGLVMKDHKHQPNFHVFVDWLMFTDEDGIIPGYFKLKYDIAKQSLFALASPSWGVWHDFTGHIDDILSKVKHEYE
jgi:hypothetical protein